MGNEFPRKIKNMLAVEKLMNDEDVSHRFWSMLAEEFGVTIEAAFARVYDVVYPGAKYRKVTIRQWENITNMAKSRKCGTSQKNETSTSLTPTIDPND